MKRTNWWWVFAAVLTVPGVCLASKQYNIADISGPGYYAYGINNHDEVVGCYSLNGDFYSGQAFKWKRGSGTTLLGKYFAGAINDSGQIAGEVYDAANRFVAGVWENGSWVKLTDRQEAVAINENGQITGLISGSTNYNNYRDDDIHSPGYITLAKPTNAATHSYDINNKGQIVADCGGIAGLYVGLFYEANGSYRVMDRGGIYDTHPLSLNEGGQIVGYGRDNGAPNSYAVMWDSPTSAVKLMGSLGTGDARAMAINDLGQAVGYSANHAFLWTRQTGMLDLNTLIDPGLGISLTRATDISDMGSITAWGKDSAGLVHSYLLTAIPEPMTLMLLGVGGMMLGRRKQGAGIRLRLEAMADKEGRSEKRKAKSEKC